MRLLEQLKQRREQLGLRQEDMELRIGMKRQQYQRLEAGGNPRLNTLDLVAQGLEGELLFIPQEKLREVKALLQQALNESSTPVTSRSSSPDRQVSEDTPTTQIESPWDGLLD